MKKRLIIIIALAFLNVMSAQTVVDIEFTKDKVVVLNGTKLGPNTSFDEVKEILGTPVVYKSYRSGKTNYHYEELGMSFHTVDDKLLFIGLNFNWDGDETFPKTLYTGTFKFGDVTIDNTSDNSFIDKIEMVTIMSVMPGLYMSNPKVESTPVIIGFKDNLVTQIGFEFH
jgi:hypothetical protein|nr:hypothetical protein [uncultured Psychroserpens sp.]